VVARGGSDVEDRASSAGHHLLDRAGGQVDDGLDIDVGRQAATVDLVEKSGASGGIRYVAGDHLDADAAREFFGQLAQPVLAASDECDTVPAVGELTRDRGADTRRCPGDDGGTGG
jgi:hypothetical protein